MISALDGYLTANEEETELTKDIASIKKLITRSLCSDKYKYPFNDLWAPFNGVIREKFLNISELLKSTFDISTGNLTYRRPNAIETYDKLELDVRKAMHPCLESLCEKASSIDVVKCIMEATKATVSGIYEDANDTVVSMYLNEIDNIAKRIRALISKTPVADREGCTEELLDILKTTPEESADIQRLMEFLRKKIGLLNSLEFRLKDYLDDIDILEDFNKK